MTTVLTWNILHGGGARRIPRIALDLLAHSPDIVLLSEFRTSMGGQLQGVLADHGLAHQLTTEPPPRTNGLLLACRWPLTPIKPTSPPPSLRARWLCARADLGAEQLHLLGAHIPETRTGSRKVDAWQFVLDAARAHLDAPTILFGDLNTGRARQDDSGIPSTCSAMMGRLWSMGYRDAWREVRGPEAREFSWFNHDGSGLRIDHALVAPALAGRVVSARYDHAPRASRTSDHAPLILQIEGKTGPDSAPTQNKTQKTGLFPVHNPIGPLHSRT